jgi:hypothetical protein
MKYTLIAEDVFDGSKTTTTREFQADYLPDVLSEVALFLKGAGFVFDGILDNVNDTFPEIDTDFESRPDWDSGLDDTIEHFPKNNWPFASAGSDTETSGAGNIHSQYYFDTERNK